MQESELVFFAQLYRPMNIRVMLVGLEVWTKHDQIVVSLISDDTLSRFIEWRKSNLLKRVKHDNAQFVTWVWPSYPFILLDD